MPRLLAIEWDAQEVRFVVARASRGGHLTVDRAQAVPLPATPDGEKRTAADLGQAIRAALSDAKIRGSIALVGVNRSAVELRQLTLPPAPEEELPELVRHQAAREFTSIGDGASLDFVSAPHDSPAARVVTAAALSDQQLVFARAVCEAAKIKPARLLLRPYAASSLLARHKTEPVAILVDGGPDETDLTVLVDGRVFLSRSLRNHPRGTEEHDADDAAADVAPLVAEIRRTVVAVRNQTGGGTVAAVYLCGDGAVEHELAEPLRNELSIPVEVFDPWSTVALAGPLRETPPEQPGRYAALLGMLADEAEERQPGLDFLNPRRKPQPVNRRRLAGIGIAAAALVALGGLYFAWEQFAEIGGRIESLERRSRDLDQLVKRGTEKQVAVAAIEDWSLGDVVWLDELRDLSLRFPQPRDAVLLRLTLSARPTGGGAVELEGLVRDPSIVGRMESQLRDEYHEVRTRRVQESVQGKTNTWKFDSSLSVSRRAKDDYLAHQPLTPPAATSPPNVASGTSTAPAAGAREGDR